MELRLLPLISYLAAGTYLMAWIIRRSWSLNVWIHDWWIRHQAAGKVRSLRSTSKRDDWIGILLNIGGAILGVFAARWAATWISLEWLLLVLLAFVLLSEEFRPSQAEMNLLAVVVLLDRVITHADAESDLFEVLSKAVQEVPEGEVQLALREALHRRRSGFSGEECLAILRGDQFPSGRIHPHHETPQLANDSSGDTGSRSAAAARRSKVGSRQPVYVAERACLALCESWEGSHARSVICVVLQWDHLCILLPGQVA